MQVEQFLIKTAGAWQAELQGVHESNRLSATNLIHYLSLRSLDIRDLQEQLHEAGLSALSNSESHILYQIQAILHWLGIETPRERLFPCDNQAGRISLQKKAIQLFGNKESDRIPYIMVTFDLSFAQDTAFVKKLLKEGMNVARINCAHDDEGVWKMMIGTLKKAAAESGYSCKIYMDLAGPKIRTGLPEKGSKKGKMKIEEGQILLLAEKDHDAKKSHHQAAGRKIVTCSLNGIVEQVKAGQKVLFDDGLIGTEVIEVAGKEALLKVVRISSKKPRLKAGKGINFPETNLTVESLTEDDRRALPFAAQHAELVGYSFVRTTEDLITLQNELDKLTSAPPTIIMKIETTEAFAGLPALLMQAMTRPAGGVMIARGDLAVEAGLERLSEVQEEILWICEAAHMPVIWATQVLESLNKSGLATRSEGTDAARAALAECVMINKGDYTLEVVKVLKNILHRSTGHRSKRRHLFRPLAVADRFLKTHPGELSGIQPFSGNGENAVI